MAAKILYTDVQLYTDPVTPVPLNDIMAVEISEGHGQTTARASIELADLTNVQLNKRIAISLGFTDEYGLMFVGYIDEIVTTRPNGTYRLECRDLLKKAIEHFIVTTDLENPWSRTNIPAEDLVGDLLSEARIDTSHYHKVESLFTFGVDGPAEFNLMSSWDAINSICNILAYNCWCENGEIYFDRVFPVPDGPSTHDFTVGTGGDIISIDYTYNTDNLRNQVVVFGKEGIYAEASIPSPYLPDDFYKTAVVSSELIQTQHMADRSAEYNLELYNKLTENLRVDADGDYRVRCRDTVSVTEPFTGMDEALWFVYSISHRVDDGGYKMSLNLTR